MNTRTLLSRLMTLYGDNPNSLAAKLAAHGVKQPQIYKFQTGQTKEPKRSTLAPVADFYKVPVDAFFDEAAAAEQLAKLDQGWLPKPMWRNAATAMPAPTVNEPTASDTKTTNANADMPSIEQAFAALASRLVDIDPTSRKQAAFQLASLADSPADHHKLAALFTVTTTPSKRLRA